MTAGAVGKNIRSAAMTARISELENALAMLGGSSSDSTDLGWLNFLLLR